MQIILVRSFATGEPRAAYSRALFYFSGWLCFASTIPGKGGATRALAKKTAHHNHGIKPDTSKCTSFDG
jgi:hypothetical protein